MRIVRDGENNGVVGYVAKIDSTMPVELYRVYGHWYYQSELEPAASADARTQQMLAGGVWTSEVGDYVSASCPNINSVFEGVTAPRKSMTILAMCVSRKRTVLSAGCRWINRRSLN